MAGVAAMAPEVWASTFVIVLRFSVNVPPPAIVCWKLNTSSPPPEAAKKVADQPAIERVTREFGGTASGDVHTGRYATIPNSQIIRGNVFNATKATPFVWDQVTVTVDRVLADGDAIDGSEFRLTVLHTPGHAPNHACLFLEEERGLFTGDHVLEGTTTVVWIDEEVTE